MPLTKSRLPALPTGASTNRLPPVARIPTSLACSWSQKPTPLQSARPMTEPVNGRLWSSCASAFAGSPTTSRRRPACTALLAGRCQVVRRPPSHNSRRRSPQRIIHTNPRLRLTWPLIQPACLVRIVALLDRRCLLRCSLRVERNARQRGQPTCHIDIISLQCCFILIV